MKTQKLSRTTPPTQPTQTSQTPLAFVLSAIRQAGKLGFIGYQPLTHEDKTCAAAQLAEILLGGGT